MEETNLISAHNGRNKPNIRTQWKTYRKTYRKKGVEKSSSF